MEQIEGQPRSHAKTPPPEEMEVDFDQLEFRPLSGGLGFNSKKNNPLSMGVSNLGQRPLGNSTTTSNTASNTNLFTHRPVSSPAPTARNKEQIVQDFVKSNLQRPTSAHSAHSPISGVPQSKSSSQQKAGGRPAPLVKAPLWQIASAWASDWVILTSVFVVSVQLLMLLVLGQVNLHLFLMMDIKLKLLFTLMYLLCYCAYFSIFHLKATPGGVIAQVRLVPTYGGRITLSQTALRTVLVIASILGLGIPFIWNLPGKISETILVKP